MVNLDVNGVLYPYPEVDDNDWGDGASSWAQAITQGTLQKQGGSFTLSAEVDFGNSFGVRSKYVRCRSYCEFDNASIPATPGAGISRLYFDSGIPYYIGSSGIPHEISNPIIPPIPDFIKTYQTDIAYTNGTPTVTINAANAVKIQGYLTPYQTSDGRWWIRGYVCYSHDTQVSMELEISGMVAVGAGQIIPCACYYCDSLTGYVSDKAAGGVFNIRLDHPATYNVFIASFDVPITGKPSWAD